MTNETADTICKAMDNLLDEERSTLLKGDLDALGDMFARKEALMDQLVRLDLAPQDVKLQGIHHKLDRNQALLNSALAGIRSVARRLAMVRRVRQSLEYYDEDGAKASVDIGVERSVEKRA